MGGLEHKTRDDLEQKANHSMQCGVCGQRCRPLPPYGLEPNFIHKADRIGADCVGDLEVSRGALHMLACGSARLNAAMDAGSFSRRESLVPPVTGFLIPIFSSDPRLTRRVGEVESSLARLRSQPGLSSV